MVFVPVQNTVHAELVYSFEGSIMENNLYYQFPMGVDEDQLMTVQDNLNTWWDENIQQYQVDDLSLINVRVTDLTTENGMSLEGAVNPPAAGASATDPLPANCALQVSFTTPYRGRSYRGRIYIPGLPEDRSSGSQWTAAFLALMATAIDNLLLVDFEPYTANLVVVSRYHDGAPRAQGLHTAVSGYKISPYIVSQKRRLPGRGA